eukprot:6181169-Pleurochrysis_carterae.AAC.1
MVYWPLDRAVQERDGESAKLGVQAGRASSAKAYSVARAFSAASRSRSRAHEWPGHVAAKRTTGEARMWIRGYIGRSPQV